MSIRTSPRLESRCTEKQTSVVRKPARAGRQRALKRGSIHRKQHKANVCSAAPRTYALTKHGAILDFQRRTSTATRGVLSPAKQASVVRGKRSWSKAAGTFCSSDTTAAATRSSQGARSSSVSARPLAMAAAVAHVSENASTDFHGAGSHLSRPASAGRQHPRNLRVAALRLGARRRCAAKQ